MESVASSRFLNVHSARTPREQAADRAASAATERPEIIAAGQVAAKHSDPGSAFDELRGPMGAVFGHDFSKVRIYATGAPSDSARRSGARALTQGNHIAFAPGEWGPGTRRGVNLLAHELAHVATQSREGHERLDAKSLDEEVDEELAKHPGVDPKSLDPTSEHYALTLQEYGHTLTHKSMTELIDEPTSSPQDAKDPKKKAEFEKRRADWRRRFQKSEVVAGRILDKSGPDVLQKEQRAQMLTSDLASAGFLTEAMALARRFKDRDMRKLIYANVLDRPDKITQAQLIEITKFSLAGTDLADHHVAAKLSDMKGYSKKLPAEAVNAVLAELVDAYGKQDDLPAAVARIIFFDNRLQSGFTKMMLQKGQGALLRKISDQPYFVEGAQIQTPAGDVQPSDPQLAWAISNKQQVTVQEIIDLVTAAGEKISRPAKFDAPTLKAWLEANTEKIGAALKKQHPTDPDAAEVMLRNITTSFMWHVDPDAEDIKPDPHGHITHLTAASGGQKAQLKVDCDVLATYNVRLLVAAGFTPVGYMAVVPTDTKRAPHAMALVQHGQTYRALSNVESQSFPVTPNKNDALKRLRDFGINEAYDASRPLGGYNIYYLDSDAKGTLPPEVENSDPSALQKSLSK